MQTFLPDPDFAASAAALDDRRLGKQRVEAFQILRALTWTTYGWKNHPAVRMWRGFVPALVCYGLAVTDEWIVRGRADTVRPQLLAFTDGTAPSYRRLHEHGQLPPWLGLPALHASHQSSLVRKDPGHYRTRFSDVPDDLPYHWPPAAFPRWPLAHPAQPSLTEALGALGYTTPRHGQAAAVEAVVAGRDVVLRLPRGGGSSSAGLLAALVRPGSTLWIFPAPGGRPLTTTAGGPDGPEETPEEFAFLSPDRLVQPAVATYLAAAKPGLVVVDDASRLDAATAADVSRAVHDLGSPPVLVVSAAHEPSAEHWRSVLAQPLDVVG